MMEFEHPPPRNDDLENALLSGVIWLNNAELGAEVLKRCDYTVFTTDAHKIMRDVLLNLCDTDALSATTVHLRCKEKGLEGLAVHMLAHEADVSKNALRSIATQLLELGHRRARMIQCYAMLDDCQRLDVSMVELEERDMKYHDENVAAFSSTEIPPISHSLDAYDAYMAELKSGKRVLLNTGVDPIDRQMEILPEYIILAARTSIGKTALALSAALYQTCVMRRHIAFFSMEQTEVQLTVKILSTLTGLSGRQVMGLDGLTHNQENLLLEAREVMLKLPLTIIYGPRTVENVWGTCARLADGDGLDGVYVDQLDKFVFNESLPNLERQMAAVSKALYRLQQQLRCFLCLLHQVNIGDEHKFPNPQMSLIRDCKQVAQDADKVWLLDRPESSDERMKVYEESRAKAVKQGNIDKAELLDMRGIALFRQTKDRNGTGRGTWRRKIEYHAHCGSFVRFNLGVDEEQGY